MIIQCRQCRTRFRFDESLMESDGMWMRCSRCRHVFFQDNPAKLSKPVVEPPPASVVSPQPSVEEKASAPLSFEAAQSRPRPPLYDEDMKNFLQGVLEGDEKSGIVTEPKDEPPRELRRRSAPEEPGDFEPEVAVPQDSGYRLEPEPEFEFEPEPSRESWPEPEPEREFRFLPEERPGADDIVLEPEVDGIDEYDLPDEEIEQTQTPERKKRRFWIAALWAFLVIVVVPSVIYTFVIPQQGRRLAGMLADQGRHLKMAFSDKPQRADGQFVISQIKIQDVQQRVVNNYLLGSIRVVEGIAVNQADFPVTRVTVRADLLDAYSVMLESRVSYAGNILTDDELMNLTDEEMLTRLSFPEGRENSNERVIPNGQIPFMIVFITVPQNAIKTTVAVSGAERLL